MVDLTPLPAPRSQGRLLTDGWCLASGDAPTAADWQALDAPATVAQALALSAEDAAAADLDGRTWWYRCRFDLAPAELDHALRLGFDGLATQVSVWLNGELQLSSSSMFVRHQQVIAAAQWRPTGNELLIRVEALSPLLAQQRKPRARWRAPMVAHTGLRWWRTSLLGRTPGWSPAWPPVGLTGAVWLSPADADAPSALQLDTGLSEAGVGQLSLGLDLPEGATEVHLSVTGRDERWQFPLTPNQGRWQLRTEVPGAQAWWPHTHGAPVRYALALAWRSARSELRHSPLGHTGFRRVALLTQEGGFAIEVNGVPVFARGACWTPMDARSLQASPAQLDAELQRLRAAGINMLRLSGATLYEGDAFFDACDAHGVMVWQDLMFANMDYPATDAAFQAQVAAELDTQMSIWRGRPCLAVVCGNSEVAQQAAMWGADASLWQPALFHEQLRERITHELPGVPYWPGSSIGGAYPFQPSAGTTSYYGVGAYRRGTRDATDSGLRFATECLALAQVPGERGMARLRVAAGGTTPPVHSPAWKAGVPRDLGAGWDFDDIRDHYVERLYGESVEALRRSQPARHLQLGRAVGAELITRCFSRWRRPGSACSGALVWFLRDLRPGAGWGLIDDAGDPKQAFHALADVCQPQHLGVTDEGMNGLHLHAVNDGAEARHGSLHWRLWRDADVTVAEGQQTLSVPARGSISLGVSSLLPGFLDVNWAFRFGPPPAHGLYLQWLGESGELIAERVHFIDLPDDEAPRPLGHAGDPGLHAVAASQDDGSWLVTVGSRGAARAVYFEAEGWSPSVEGFHLAPGTARTVRFTPWPGTSAPWHASVGAINAKTTVVVTHAR